MLRQFSLIALLLVAAPSFAGPGLIQYQGRLTDPAGNPITTPVSITFTFWSAATGGAQLGGTYYDTDTVTPNSQGLYSTMIGDETGAKIPDVIFTAPQVWLNVNIGSENLSPRKQMVATAYSFQSNYATTATASLDTLAGVTSRGASTGKELTLSGGAKTNKISPLTPGGSVQVEGVYMIAGSVALPAIAPPASTANKVYFANGSLNWQGVPVMLMRGENYIVVQTTSNPVTNGSNLVSAYHYAKTLRPNGQDLETSNRLTVLVPPGLYQLTAGQLTLDAEFVDLVGLSTARADQYLFGNLTAEGTSLVCQSANDVRIENLTIAATCATYYSTKPVAYFPESNRTRTVIRNCEFIGNDHAESMRKGVDYRGRYEDCTAGSFAFGYYGAANGQFIRCSAGTNSFGNHGAASGTFIDCYAGPSSFGSTGAASGSFTGCTCSGSGFGVYGSATGKFVNCTAGVRSFGCEETAGGTFENCVAGDDSFGMNGVASGIFINCRGGDHAFAHCGTASGTFTNCAAGTYSFGAGSSVVPGIASGTFTNCTASGYSFGASTFFDADSTKSTCSGTFINCVGGYKSFGGDRSFNSAAKLRGCHMNSSTWSGTWSGTMENCRWNAGVTCDASARIYGSTFLGTLNLNHVAAGVTQCRARAIANSENNAFGATNAAAFNIADGDVQ
ncbi:hypothetical protein LLG95_01850 [bacterium]|nr:hypothetical protein [bacterium]